MPKHLDKVRAHADEKLGRARKTDRSRADLIKLYKRFLKIEEHRIKLEHNAGAGGFEIARKRSDLLDVVLSNLLEEAVASLPGSSRKSPVTLVAHGGYGRALLNPGSDIDLLFLRRDSGARVPKALGEIIEQVLYMLWDVGFKVGHATRTLKESVRQANEDYQTKSAIIESRLITGEQTLFDNFRTLFRKQCIDGHEKAYLADRVADFEARYAKFSNTVYLQEPHVKNGVGGLRDFHNILWISYVKRGTYDLPDLVRDRTLTKQAYRELERAHDFLLRVRNDLHYTEKRATDTLTLRLQGTVATHFKYPQKNILRRCEEFMRDYYMHTRNMSQHATSLLERFELELSETPSAGAKLVNFLTLGGPKVSRFDGFVSKDGWLYPGSQEMFDEDSDRLVRIYLHLQQRGLKMSPQLRQLIKRRWQLIDRPFRYRKSVFETFEAILMRKGEVARVFRAMHRSGFLGRYFPEFGALECLVQHEFFHRYTADEHTLTCIDKLDELSDTSEPKLKLYQKLFHKVEDPVPIYLALLLHDSGRARNQETHADASAVLANRVCNRLSIRLDRRRLINFLVDNHLTFYRTATQRNISDPDVIEEFAKIVRNRHYLDMLLLHTYADSKGTNEEAWSDWKESLILQLYHSTALYLEDRGAFDYRKNVPSKDVRNRVTTALQDDFADDIEAHFTLMPRRYFLFRSAASVSRHIKTVRKFLALEAEAEEGPKMPPHLDWFDRPKRGSSELYVTTRDRPGLLATITGALAASGVNVLGADLFTREDGVVLDVFRVCSTSFGPVKSAETRRQVADLVRQAHDDPTFDFADLIAKKIASSRRGASSPYSFPTRATVSNTTSPNYTVIELQALDRLGLLYDVFRAIVELGYDVTFARVNTEKGAAIDTFYVTKADGGKLSYPDETYALASVLERYLDGTPA